MKTCMQRPWMMLVRLEINCNKYPMCDVLWSDLKRTPDVVGQTLSTRCHYNQLTINHSLFEVSNNIMISLYLQRFVLSAAHCFCRKGHDKSKMKCVWNNAKRGSKGPDGHYTWSGSTRDSR